MRLSVPKAVVVLVAGQQPSPELARDIFAFTRERLAPYKRIRRLFLTPQGHALALQSLEDECVLFDEMMTALSEEECNALGDSMRRLGDHLKSGLPPKEG